RITLTPDAQAIDTTLLGFTISPHEECAVEEALRITEQHGGSTTVLTLGPLGALEQLQNALAMGVGSGVLLETDGSDWNAEETAGEDDADRANRAAAARERARDDQTRRPGGAPIARRDPRRGGGGGAARRRDPARARASCVVILCLVDDDPVSLEALTFASR